MPSRKVKVSVTLSGGLLARIDRQAARKGSTRSTLIEQWLRLAGRHEAEKELDEATAAYYESLTPAEVLDDATLTQSLSAAVKRLRIDEGPTRVRRRGTAR